MKINNRKTKLINILALVVLVISAPLTVSAQKADFYGLALPGAATLQTLDFNAVDFKPLPVLHTDQNRAGPTGEALHAHVKALTDIALQSRARNPQRWGNFSGFPEEELVYAYLNNRLADAGVENIVLESFDQAPWSLTTNWSVQLMGANGESIELQSAVPMGVGNRSSIDAITAPLIYVGRGSAADLAGRDIAGKIAVIRGETAPHFYDFSTSGSMARLAEAGAVGILRLWNTPGNMQVQLGNCPEISCFNLGGEDSAFLEAVIAEAAAAGELDKITLALDISVEREVRQALNLVGKIEGSGASDENIILLAHTDTWFSGADDNASGLAVLIGLADYYGAANHQPLHDIYFVASPGHHHGAGGSSFFVENYAQLLDNNIIAINLEHVASTGVSVVDGNLMDGKLDNYGNIANSFSPTNSDGQWRGVAMSNKTPFLVSAWERASMMNMYTQPASVWERSGRLIPGEAMALDGAGLNVIQNPEVSHWYHSSGSTAETVSPESLERAYLFFSDFLNIVDGASKAEVEAR